MKCRQVQERLVDWLDSAAPREELAELDAHLAACENCARECAQIQAAIGSIQPPFRVQASPDFKERVMSKLTEVQAPPRRWRNFLPRLAVVGAAALALLLVAPFVGSIAGKRGRQSSVTSLLAQSVQAMSGLQSVHMLARMRTLPHDNFEYISADCDFVPLEIWKQFSDPPRWRVEKPGRVAAMDGTSATLWIKPLRVSRGGPQSNYLEWLNLLLDTDRILEHELAMARAGETNAALTEVIRNGARQMVLTVNRKAYSRNSNDWLRNKAVSDSDHTRVYRFDAVTSRLEGLQLVLHAGGKDTVVFEITEIRYNETLDPALFTLQVPANVITAATPASGPQPKSPKEAAALLFDAFSRQDWDQALAVHPWSGFEPRFKEMFGGMQVISLGEPFQSGLYPGWFVPYEVRLKSGQVRKHNLALRNDNPARRWVQDGGL
ncbi:MAG: zf-HC2 domain-containing protein [Acidobacteria bacterium]|nr:zf-HC2 domain-containing protein [Acidobacteriota bacterium]